MQIGVEINKTSIDIKPPGNSSDVISDEELVAQIIKTKGDALFAVLYKRYAKLVYNKSYGFTQSKDEASDLTQDVFIKLFLNLKQFKGKAKFSTWLYSFVYNMCVDYVKKKNYNNRRQYEESLNPETEELLIDVKDHTLFQLKSYKLKKAIELIQPEDKMILLLKYQDDFSIRDIAQMMNIGESATKMRIKRAKSRIVKEYNNV